MPLPHQPALSRRRMLQLSALGAGVLLSRAWQGEAHAAGQSTGALRIALISDLNSSYGSTHYVPQVARGVELLLSLRPDLVLCAGDMVAGQKAGLSQAQLDAMWASFADRVLAPLRSAGIPFAPAMGNHDASSSRRNGAFAFALDRQRAQAFWRPRAASLGLNVVEGAAFPFRYSLLEGGVFTLVLDASSATLDAEQLAWAEQQLGTPAARSARLGLVVGHLPLYAVSQGRDRPGEVLDQPERLRQLLERHGVSAYISGHHHAYFPSRVGRLNLLSLGAMGSGPRRLLQNPPAPSQSLTLLELPAAGSSATTADATTARETTYDLNTLRPIPPNALPQALQPSRGPRLPRREPGLPLS
ncbi:MULTISPECIES: metallophosphoesterase family protein [Aphanothece]|uniref:metallophosphoesterase family protein n=1 Tax=Aphanothece TaxID=1121 RepID=UPI003984A9CC